MKKFKLWLITKAKKQIFRTNNYSSKKKILIL